jgi:hypothetical protein
MIDLGSRRDWLRGVSLGSSGLLLSPVLRQLQAHAAGVDARPRRFVFVVEGNGLIPEQIQPQGITRRKDNYGRSKGDSVIDRPLAGHQLPRALEPLAPYRESLSIIQGLSGRICGGGHSNNFGALGVYPGKSGPAGETIDAALAKALPGIFPHLGLGISDRPEHSVIYNISALAPGKALPTQCRPDLAYAALFGSVAEGNGKKAFDAQANLLDFMVEDVRRLERELAGPEREKLQDYLHSYEGMRDRQGKLQSLEKTLRERGPKPTKAFASDVESERLEAQFDLAAGALACGLTNVVTISSGSGDPYFSVRFRGLGIDLDKHSIGHGKGINEQTSYQLSETIRRFHMEQIARLIGKLKAMPEGDGTMFDNTLIVYLSDSAESHHSRCFDWPFVLLGNLGGRIKTGRYVEFPKYQTPGHRTIANLYQSFLHAAGAPRETFGVDDPNLKGIDTRGPLAELLA